MEQQERYHEGRHYSGVTDPHLQPAWLCVPQIKVENDLGVYRCQTSQHINHAIHSTNSCMGFSQNPHECHSPYNKDSLLSIDHSSTDFCENRRIHSTVLPNNVGCNENLLSPSQQPSAETSCQNLRPEQGNAQYLSSGQEHDEQIVRKDMKRIKSLWPASQRQNEGLQSHLPPIDKENSGNLVSAEDPVAKNIENNDCEPNEAFDLTCQSKILSKEEEGLSNDSHATSKEEASSSHIHARCAPKPQMCKICGKVLSSPSSYYVHMKLHSGNKPYACTMCEASFCRKPYLEVHMRTHTGERPFECNTCNKRFTQKSSLNTHKRVHTGERPYSCDICQKTFAVKSYVTAHRWSHVSEKPLACERCGLTFTSKNLFALHIRTHIDQNHECQICGRSFMKDSYLIRHQNRVHRESCASYSEVDESRSPSSSPPSTDSLCPQITL